MTDWLQRSELLIKPEGIEKLKKANVLVVGLGGVGSFAAEFLARAGVGNLTIVDGDVVDITNVNRQLPALHTTVGKDKVEVVAERILDINPEINLREVSANGRYWENGQWIETTPLEIRVDHDYPEVGVKPSYLLYHEELESLSKNIKGLKRIRFFMTFGDAYIQHMNCLQNVGMLGIEPVEHQGQKIIPIEFLKTLLPDPASLGPRTVGKTNIGCIIEGIKDGKPRKVYIYNVCDHQECYRETGAQAVSYTTGVPAMIGSKLLYKGVWKNKGVFNIEEFDAKPFMDELMTQGLPWKILELDVK